MSMEDDTVEIDAPLPSVRGRGSSGLKSVHPPPLNRLLKQRIITVDEYARELARGKMPMDERMRRFGTSVVPVPVPLALGESEDQYEQRFLMWLSDRGITLETLATQPNNERMLRLAYAKLATRRSLSAPIEAKKLGPPLHKRPRADSDQGGDRSSHKSPRHLALVHEYIGIDQYRADSRAGRFVRIKNMTHSEKLREFNSPYSHIYVPLAHGETEHEYEERFLDWLESEHDTTVEELERHPNRLQERYMRIMFATANAHGVEEYYPPHKPRDAVNKVRRNPPPVEVAKHECTGRDTATARGLCGCRNCLKRGLQELTEQITKMEGPLVEKESDTGTAAAATSVVDLTFDTSDDTMAQDADQIHLAPDDPMDEKLLAEYNDTNDQIVLNERALEASVASLSSEPITDIQVITQLQDENQELCELILEEYSRRNAALAVLIVWLWRDQIPDLKRMVEDKRASDVPHVQRACHHRCADLVRPIAEKRRILVGNELQIQAGRYQLEHYDLLKLIRQRLREFMTLVHFDQHLRECIQDLLGRL